MADRQKRRRRKQPRATARNRRTDMNKYQDSNGIWIGPRDKKSGMPQYHSPVTITASRRGKVVTTWTATNELSIPEGCDIYELMDDADADSITLDSNGENIGTWHISKITFNFGEELHRAIINH
jgi:hypothetical protein